MIISLEASLIYYNNNLEWNRKNDKGEWIDGTDESTDSRTIF